MDLQLLWLHPGRIMDTSGMRQARAGAAPPAGAGLLEGEVGRAIITFVSDDEGRPAGPSLPPLQTAPIQSSDRFCSSCE